MSATVAKPGGATAKLGKYLAVAKVQATNALAYPGEVLSRSLTIVIFMWVFVHLWQAVYAQGDVPRAQLAGLGLTDVLWYLLMAEAIVLSQPRISTQVAEAVKDGSIAYVLNKPYDFLLYQAGSALGDSLPRFGANLLAGGLVVWAVVGPPPVHSGWWLAAVSVVAAWAINFCMNAAIGLLAFVTEDISAFEWIQSKFVLILGGVLIPLDFFPDWLSQAARLLPFAQAVYTPAMAFVGIADAGGLALQLGWLLALSAGLWILYRRSLAWLTINGG